MAGGPFRADFVAASAAASIKRDNFRATNKTSPFFPISSKMIIAQQTRTNSIARVWSLVHLATLKCVYLLCNNLEISMEALGSIGSWLASGSLSWLQHRSSKE